MCGSAESTLFYTPTAEVAMRSYSKNKEWKKRYKRRMIRKSDGTVNYLEVF